MINRSLASIDNMDKSGRTRTTEQEAQDVAEHIGGYYKYKYILKDLQIKPTNYNLAVQKWERLKFK